MADWRRAALQAAKAAAKAAGPALVAGAADVAKSAARGHVPRRRRAVVDAGIDSAGALAQALLSGEGQLALSAEAVLVQALAQLPTARFEMLERALAQAKQLRG